MPIRPARVPDEVPAVRDLFLAYAAGLGVDLCFQSFDAELAALPGAYAPPPGRLLVAEEGPELAGCVALRPQRVRAADPARPDPYGGVLHQISLSALGK